MRPDTRSYPDSCFAIDPHDQTGRHERLPHNHTSQLAEACPRRIGWPRNTCRLESSDTAEPRRRSGSSVSDTDPVVCDPDIVADNAAARYVVRALRAVDVASRVAAAVAVAVDTAPPAVAGTVDPVVAAAPSPAAIAAVVTCAAPVFAVDEPAAGSAALARQPPGSAVCVEPSVVDAAVEGSGPAGLESAVFGFSQPAAVAVVVAAVELAEPVPAVFVVVVQLSVGSAAAEPAVVVVVVVVVAVAVCVAASVGAVLQFFAHSFRRLCRGVTRRQ